MFTVKKPTKTKKEAADDLRNKAVCLFKKVREIAYNSCIK